MKVYIAEKSLFLGYFWGNVWMSLEITIAPCKGRDGHVPLGGTGINQDEARLASRVGSTVDFYGRHCFILLIVR